MTRVKKMHRLRISRKLSIFFALLLAGVLSSASTAEAYAGCYYDRELEVGSTSAEYGSKRYFGGNKLELRFSPNELEERSLGRPHPELAIKIVPRRVISGERDRYYRTKYCTTPQTGCTVKWHGNEPGDFIFRYYLTIPGKDGFLGTGRTNWGRAYFGEVDLCS